MQCFCPNPYRLGVFRVSEVKDGASEYAFLFLNVSAVNIGCHLINICFTVTTFLINIYGERAACALKGLALVGQTVKYTPHS